MIFSLFATNAVSLLSFSFVSISLLVLLLVGEHGQPIPFLIEFSVIGATLVGRAVVDVVLVKFSGEERTIEDGFFERGVNAASEIVDWRTTNDNRYRTVRKRTKQTYSNSQNHQLQHVTHTKIHSLSYRVAPIVTYQ